MTRSPSSLLLALSTSVLPWGCALESAPPAELRVDIAPLSLIGVGDVIWDVEVTTGSPAETVWSRRLTSSRTGDGRGAATWVGPCDASRPAHIVKLWLVGAYAAPVTSAGTFASGDDSTITDTALPLVNPTSAGPLELPATCRPNADTLVVFDLTVMRPAQQGFFDIAVNFDDIFCSAKFDCCRDADADGACDGPLSLLHDDTGLRGPTMVLAFACTAGVGNDTRTALYLDDLEFDCSGPTDPFSADLRIDPSAGPGNLCIAGEAETCAAVSSPSLDADDFLFQVTTYRGEEALTTGDQPANKLYWNVAFGVRPGAIGACRLITRGTADDAAASPDVDGRVIGAGLTYPVLEWDLDLGACVAEPLTLGDPDAPVRTTYTKPSDPPTTFDHIYLPDATPDACDPACSANGTCVLDLCLCDPGYGGPTCADLLATPLTMDVATLPSNAQKPVALGDVILFTADDGVSGYELWVTDLTAANTRRLIDLEPGPDGSDPVLLAVHAGFAWFSASTSGLGTELWRTDGTAANTTLVKDINPGEASSSPSLAWSVGDKLLFVANDGVNGAELWVTDGTETNTTLVKDIYPGATSAGLLTNAAVVLGDALYFRATHPDYGTELWKSDGTTSGTDLVKDIYLGAASSNPIELIAMGGFVYFRARTFAEGEELWKSDGTLAGTVLVKDLNPGPAYGSPEALAPMGGYLYFSGRTDTTGQELYRTDGTAPGTTLVKDIRSGSGGSDPSLLTAVGTTVYFVARDDANGRELWRSDGTSANTALVADLSPGPDNSSFSSVPGLIPFGAGIAFVFSGGTGWDLWVSDGTALGTEMLATTVSQISFLAAGSKLMFTREDVKSYDLWTTQGTPATTEPLLDLNTQMFHTAVLGADELYVFSGGNDATGIELMATDGTVSGTEPVADIDPGPRGSKPGRITPMASVGDQVFFSASRLIGPETKTSIWATNGASASLLVAGEPNASWMTTSGTTLYFAADNTPGTDLWVSPSPQTAATPIEPYPSSAVGLAPSEQVAFGGGVLLAGFDDTFDVELWKSDGTLLGTARVADIRPGSGFSNGSSPRLLTTLSAQVFFTADNGTSGRELWRTDGTEAGTNLVMDIVPGATPSTPEKLTAAGSVLYFTADDGVHGRELWRSDGTTTALVKDLRPGATSGAIDHLTAFGGRVAFIANDGVHGPELWLTDGNDLGTVLVADLESGPVGSLPAALTPVGVWLYFAAETTASGRELWRTDGTTTSLVLDLLGGPASSHVHSLRYALDALYFSARDGAGSSALWRFVPGP